MTTICQRAGMHPARQALLRKEALGILAAEYHGRERAYEEEAQRLKRAADGVMRIFGERFDFGRANELARLATRHLWDAVVKAVPPTLFWG